jgi:hypothetical protein
MTIARSGPTATLIQGSGTALDGKVLIVGGSTGQSWLSVATPSIPALSQIALNSAEIYDPATDAFTTIASVPGCPTGESSLTTPACTTGLPSTCPEAPTTITSAAESGTTVTITATANPPGLIVGDNVSISSVKIASVIGAAGYNGTFTVTGPGATGTVVTGTTFTYTAAVSGLGAGSGGTASADTTQCGMVDQGAALIPNDQGRVLMAGGDLVTFLGQSSPLSFIFDPIKTLTPGQYWTETGSLGTPRELFALNAMDPKVVTGSLSGEVVAFGGVEGNSSVCTNGFIVVTTLNTAEVFDPTTQLWSAAANTMGAKRAGYATQFDNVTDTLAGYVILAGGVDVEAGTLPSTCVNTTASLKQAATAETDLYDPMTGTGGTFAATGSLTQAREGQVQAELGGTGPNPFDIIAIGGACTKSPTNANLSSWVIGTDAAASQFFGCSPYANAGPTGYYSELYSQSSKTWTKGPLLLGTATPTNAAASAVLP